jgi:hypothetical protein
MYMGQIQDRGYILPADRARAILAAFNISADTKLDPIEGLQVSYGGSDYWIGQADYYIPSDERPDGWHFVYAMSEQEAQNWPDTPEPENGFDWNTLVKTAAFAVGAYLAVNVLHFFKK